MCSGVGESEGKSFYDKEAAFYESLKEKGIIKDNKKPENIEGVVDEGKKLIEKVIGEK